MPYSPDGLSFYCGTAEKHATITAENSFLDNNGSLMGWCTGCEKKCPRAIYGKIPECEYLLQRQIASKESED